MSWQKRSTLTAIALGVRLACCLWGVGSGAVVWSQSTPTGEPQSATPIVIAHRGASGYLPEHTEGAKVLAVAQGADYIEQDVVLSRDGQFVVCHDITLQETTDVEERFPARRRDDGKFYCADFDWSELQQLTVHERTRGADHQAVYAGRFPGAAGQRLIRLEDELRLLRGLEQTLGRPIGFYIELKSPAWHHQHFGGHMSDRLLPLLARYDLQQPPARCFLQCFEPAELQYLATELKCQLPLIQLLGARPLGLIPDAAGPEAGKARAIAMLKAELAEIAKYADGIGPSLDVVAQSTQAGVVSTGLSEAAQAAGLQVHPYTVRADALPAWAADIQAVHRLLLDTLQVDGFFTDFPDLGRAAVDSL